MGLSSENGRKEKRSEQSDVINEWKNNPFSPHLIARYRNVAYQKNVIMKYLDILIAWADNLFTQDSVESITEATQLYVLADEMLGKKPEKVESAMVQENKASYNDIGSGLDDFSNALFDFENILIGQELTQGNKEKVHTKTASSYLSYMTKSVSSGLSSATPVSQLKSLIHSIAYFKIPMNDKLLSYWDTIADRLFKIRNSLNIDGSKRELALFQPPIDPGMLVRARAAGVDISSILSSFSSTRYPYRFATWIQKSIDLCNDLKSFGGAILQAIEKKDAEALQLLRSDQEMKMLELTSAVKKLQVEEATFAIEALEKQYEAANIRFEYYDSRKKKNRMEWTQIGLLKGASALDNNANILNTVAGFVSLIPQIHATFVPDVEFGGQQIAGLLKASATALTSHSSAMKSTANISSIEASFERRWDDWQLQKNLADNELKQLAETDFDNGYVKCVFTNITITDLISDEISIEHEFPEGTLEDIILILPYTV